MLMKNMQSPKFCICKPSCRRWNSCLSTGGGPFVCEYTHSAQGQTLPAVWIRDFSNTSLIVQKQVKPGNVFSIVQINCLPTMSLC